MIFSRFKWKNDSVLELTEPLHAYIYYRDYRFNLLTGFPETYKFELLLNQLDQLPLQSVVEKPRVFHFYYEFGLVQQGLQHLVEANAPLVIDIEYRLHKKLKPKKSQRKNLELITLERPTWTEYKEAFAKVQQELRDGNCYQVNLTYPFDFMTEEAIDPRDLTDYFFSQKKLGAYAHATYLGEELILSNSPECLFQYQNQQVFTMPIKGTVQRNGRPWKKLWQKMLSNSKEEGELIMIADLLKNDLNKLDRPEARVRKLRAPLLVPGLLHQYSLISVRLHQDVSLLKTMKCLFPGGSITGAPKTRVMEIIGGLERYQRGVYCGSTLLCFGKRKMASINIRTAVVQLEQKLWRYGAGGGVTLLSSAVSEFKEMEAKVSSFLRFLNVPGH